MSQAISKGTKCCLRWHSLNGHVLLTAVLLWLIERQLNFTEMNQCLQVCSANRSSSALPWRIPRYLKSPNNSTRYMFRGQFGFVENIFFLYKNVRIMLRFLYNWEGGGGSIKTSFLISCMIEGLCITSVQVKGQHYLTGKQACRFVETFCWNL